MSEVDWSSEEKVRDWATACFKEKDKLLDQYYQDKGEWAGEGARACVVWGGLLVVACLSVRDSAFPVLEGPTSQG
jgi:hypothetical protein